MPPETKKGDVNVKIKRGDVRVEVAGHPFKPIINGKFPHPIDQEAAEWTLQGRGSNRVLVLDLEKKSGGLEWPSLVETEGLRSGDELADFEAALAAWGAVDGTDPGSRVSGGESRPPTEEDKKDELNVVIGNAWRNADMLMKTGGDGTECQLLEG